MFCLLTFPRSGSVFFIKSTRIKLNRTHNIGDIPDKNVVLGILRNPLDSITSYAAMLDYYKQNYDIYMLISWYKDIYNFYINNNCFLILNEDLRNNAKTSIENFFYSYKNKNVFDRQGVGKQLDGYLISSKQNDNYEKIKNDVKKYDLLELFRLYEKAKEKVMPINLESFQ
jgi:hypothetical protein